MLRFVRPANQSHDFLTDSPTLESIPVDSVRPNPYQPRKIFSEEAIQELAGSIRQMGLLQPITVRRTGRDSYELVAGERRLRACKAAGLTEVRAIVLASAIDQDMAMIAMIENLQRENLHFFEEAEGYLSLIREHGFTQEELARRISKNQSTIANKLRILRLPRPVKDAILQYDLTERHARALLRLHNQEAQLKLAEQVAAGGLSVKATEELVQAELRRLYGESDEELPSPRMRFGCNYKLYLNTLRKSVEKISAFGVNTQFDYVENPDCLEVLVKIYK